MAALSLAGIHVRRRAIEMFNPCTECGSNDVTYRGDASIGGRTFHEMVCNACGFEYKVLVPPGAADGWDFLDPYG